MIRDSGLLFWPPCIASPLAACGFDEEILRHFGLTATNYPVNLT